MCGGGLKHNQVLWIVGGSETSSLGMKIIVRYRGGTR